MGGSSMPLLCLLNEQCHRLSEKSILSACQLFHLSQALIRCFFFWCFYSRLFMCIRTGGYKHTPGNLFDHMEYGSTSAATFDHGVISSSPPKPSPHSGSCFISAQLVQALTHNANMEYTVPHKIIQCEVQHKHRSHIDLTGEDATPICPDYDGFVEFWSRTLNVHYVCAVVSVGVTGAVRTCPPLTEMSSAVTLTDPVSLTEWPFALSQTDVCSCQSHALKKTRGSYNMA